MSEVTCTGKTTIKLFLQTAFVVFRGSTHGKEVAGELENYKLRWLFVVS